MELFIYPLGIIIVLAFRLAIVPRNHSVMTNFYLSLLWPALFVVTVLNAARQDAKKHQKI